MTACAVILGATLVPYHQAAAVSSAALSITPKKNYTIEPGKSAKDTLIIRNLDQERELDLTLRVVDFTYTDEGGTPKLMLAEDAPQTTWSAKPFLTVPKTVTVPAKGSKTIDMGIAVPAKHGAGSYYSAIVYSSGAAPDGGNVGLNASGVTLAFVNIPGEVKENLTLEKFGAYVPGKNNSANYTSFTTNDPRNIAYTLKNNGNVTEAPAGSITVKPLFGNDKTITEINPNKSLALIGQTRTYTTCVALKYDQRQFEGGSAESTECTNSGLWPGFYRLSLDMYYGQNGNRTQDLLGSSWFIYAPIWSIIVFILALLVIAYFGYRAYSSVRGKVGKKSSRKK